ncbi:nucleotidyltransferase domain-containing protein [Nocardioides euryhalodurans]|uniref:Nucleotidyltransferase domain-containing protein n=1 Tax=Nocardioides euryhalodurans TaxID=2518370 RepID=A0A4P7GN20_9ACTN|nr:nucleotidyltransferase domain-containing protein [Nocardioides euryhalodurans]QBR93284.1 nucleotidyltransferase domain-containing protein [Nocardioides euryhalodurans]
MEVAKHSDRVVLADRWEPEDILEHLQGQVVAAMLYGSRARGEARSDSDVDVLQVVDHGPRSYSVGNLNVSAYTVDHLRLLADRGSLFVRHLRDEGITLQDPVGVLQQCLSAYRTPESYTAMRRELATVVAALQLAGIEAYLPSACKTASFAVRSLLYAACAENGPSEFDVLRASERLGRPQIGIDLRDPEPGLDNLLAHAAWLLEQAAVVVPSDLGDSFEEAVIWTGIAHPISGALLESVLADAASIDYTSLSLPMS